MKMIKKFEQFINENYIDSSEWSKANSYIQEIYKNGNDRLDASMTATSNETEYEIISDVIEKFKALKKEYPYLAEEFDEEIERMLLTLNDMRPEILQSLKKHE